MGRLTSVFLQLFYFARKGVYPGQLVSDSAGNFQSSLRSFAAPCQMFGRETPPSGVTNLPKPLE
jgi:hypothetical protein